MDDNNRNHVNMGGKVVICLTDNAADIAGGNAHVAGIRATLIAKIAEANTNDIQATLDNTGIAEAKLGKRLELTDDVRKCSSFLVLMCLHTTPIDTILQRQIDFGKSEVETKPDNDFLNMATFVSDLAGDAANVTRLATEGYLPAAYTTFNSNIGAFRALINKPKEAINKAAAYRLEVDKNIAEMMVILELLDKEMAIFEFINAIIFNEYKNARGIDGTPGSPGDEFADTLDGSAQKRITLLDYNPDAVIQFVVTGSTAVEFSLRDNSGNVLGTPITVAPGSSQNRTMAEFATSGVSLWAKNTSDSALASYQVTLL